MADRDPQPLSPDPTAYGTDVHAWALAQAELLRARRFDALDIANIAEEIESLGNEQAHAVESHLIVLVEHLLKLAVSADKDPRRQWRLSVINARSGLARRLRKNPSLRREVPDMFAEVWDDARQAAIGGLREAEETLVPPEPPFTLEQALDPKYFPGE